MRKFLIVFAALALVAAFTLPAMAADIKFKGDIRYRGYALDNFDRDDDTGDSEQAMDARGRFRMDIKTSNDLYGRFWFEIGDEFIGQASTDSGEPGFRNDNDQKEVEVKQMFIGFKLPWSKQFEFQIGAVPAYDMPKGIVFGMDGAGIKGKYEFKNGKIIAWYLKDKESRQAAADRDLYGLIGFYNIGKNHRIGAHFNWLNDRFGKIGRPETTEAQVTSDETGTNDQIWWIGFTAKGKIPTATPLKYSFDIIAMGGERKFDRAITSSIGVDDYEGLAIDGTLGGNIGPVYVEGFVTYASGDDNPTDKTEKLWRNIEGGKENFRRMQLVHGYKGFDGGQFSDFNGDLLDDGYNGLFMIGGKVVYKPTSKLKLTGQFANINMAEDSRKYDSVYYSTGSFDRTKYKPGNKDVGNEIDIIADYKIYKNLNLRGVFAYMWSGDAFKEESGVDGVVGSTGKKDGTNVGAVSPSDPWFLGYNFTYKF